VLDGTLNEASCCEIRALDHRFFRSLIIGNLGNLAAADQQAGIGKMQD